jgi:O-antigen/teichoic acid export membrane protein
MRVLREEWQRLSSSKMARNASWMLAGQGGNLFLQAGYFVMMSRLLGSTEYGIFIGAFAFTSFIATYSAMGSGTLLLRYVSSDAGRFAAYWGNILLTTTAMSAILILAAWFAAPHLLNPASAALVVITGLANCFCGEITRNASMVFQSFERLSVTAGLGLATSLLRLCAVTGMVLILHHATALQWSIASLSVSALAAIAAIVAVTICYGWPKFSLQLMRRHSAEGFGYSFAFSTSVIYSDVDKTMLSRYGMNAANGIYALAYRAIDMASMPVIALRDAAVPKFFRAGAQNRNEARLLAFRLLKRSVPVSLLVSLTLYLAAPLVPWVAGPTFAESIWAVRWLCLLPVFRSVHQIAGTGILGLGKQSYRTAAQIVVGGTNFGLNLWFIPAYGWRGAAWTSLFADGLLATINIGLLLFLSRASEDVEPAAC